MSLRKVYYALSPKSRLIVRRIFYAPVDFLQQLVGNKENPLSPPKGLIYTGSGDFIQTGKHFLGLLKTYCSIEPHHSVLDIGCGIGRLALPLTQYLSDKGRYFGFDIVQTGIKWCKENISEKYVNFQFLYVELKNDLYTGNSAKKATEFIFPGSNESMDIVISTSVFTHMLPDDMEHYLSETYRVMKPGAKCLFTFFILNEITENQMADNDVFNFRYQYGHYSLMDEKVKEANVAYQELYLRELFEKYGFKIDKIINGHWSKAIGDGSLDFQDVVILSKK